MLRGEKGLGEEEETGGRGKRGRGEKEGGREKARTTHKSGLYNLFLSDGIVTQHVHHVGHKVLPEPDYQRSAVLLVDLHIASPYLKQNGLEIESESFAQTYMYMYLRL